MKYSSSVTWRGRKPERPWQKDVLQPNTPLLIKSTLEAQCLKYARSEREIALEPLLSQTNRSTIHIRST